MIGYFRLYNVCAWRFVLSKGGGTPNAVSGLIFDPAKPAKWNRINKDGPINYDLLALPSDPSDLTDTRAGLIRIFDSYYAEARKREIGRIIQNSLADNGLKDGDLLSERFIRDIAERMTCWMMGIPHRRAVDVATFRNLAGR